jgi:hypothetical protein
MAKMFFHFIFSFLLLHWKHSAEKNIFLGLVSCQILNAEDEIISESVRRSFYFCAKLDGREKLSWIFCFDVDFVYLKRARVSHGIQSIFKNFSKVMRGKFEIKNSSRKNRWKIDFNDFLSGDTWERRPVDLQIYFSRLWCIGENKKNHPRSNVNCSWLWTRRKFYDEFSNWQGFWLKVLWKWF